MKDHAQHVASPRDFRKVLEQLPVLLAEDVKDATLKDFQRYIELAQNAPSN